MPEAYITQDEAKLLQAMKISENRGLLEQFLECLSKAGDTVRQSSEEFTTIGRLKVAVLTLQKMAAAKNFRIELHSLYDGQDFINRCAAIDRQYIMQEAKKFRETFGNPPREGFETVEGVNALVDKFLSHVVKQARSPGGG